MIRKNDFCETCRLGKRKVRFCLRSLLCYSVLNTRLVKHAMCPIRSPGFRFGPDFHISLQSLLQPLDTRSGERLATRTLVRNSYSKHTVGGNLHLLVNRWIALARRNYLVVITTCRRLMTSSMSRF